jgi:hypothetical protein
MSTSISLASFNPRKRKPDAEPESQRSELRRRSSSGHNSIGADCSASGAEAISARQEKFKDRMSKELKDLCIECPDIIQHCGDLFQKPGPQIVEKVQRAFV